MLPAGRPHVKTNKVRITIFTKHRRSVSLTVIHSNTWNGVTDRHSFRYELAGKLAPEGLPYVTRAGTVVVVLWRDRGLNAKLLPFESLYAVHTCSKPQATSAQGTARQPKCMSSSISIADLLSNLRSKSPVICASFGALCMPCLQALLGFHCRLDRRSDFGDRNQLRRHRRCRCQC